MPGKVKVRILAARHLPVMDRSSENTDAFAEVKFGEVTHKTEVVRKSLNPQWNSEWFHFEAADDMKLQDEPLQIRVMDYDTYSANDAIGKVYIDLNPLLWPSVAVNAGRSNQAWSDSSTGGLVHTPGGSLMSGWLPIYDTMHGIRGEVNVIVKIEFFSDFNQFRQSSCGVQFFYSPCVPEGYRVQAINGFVEELVVNDDPEYQWIDKIRTPRASNEARQTLFMKLSGTIQRKIGLKALELGGNVVVGYQQKFDIEGDTGIAVRGIGTAMSLVRDDPVTISSTVMNGSGSNKGLSENRESVEPPSCYYYHANDHFNSPHPIIGSNPDPKTHARSGIDATMSEFCLLSASPPQFEPFHHVKSAKPFGIGAFVAEVATKFDNSQQRIVHLRSVSSAGLISPIWSSPTHPHRSSLRQGSQQRKVSSMKARFSSTAELISPTRHTNTTTPSSFQGSSASLNALHRRDRSLSRIFKAFKGFAKGPKHSSSISLNRASLVSLEESVPEEPENFWGVQDLIEKKPEVKTNTIDDDIDPDCSEGSLKQKSNRNRQDSAMSSNTSEVTFINTILNKGLASEGDLVRMKLSQCHTVQWSPVAPIIGVPVAQSQSPPFHVDPATPTPVEYTYSPLSKTSMRIPDSISSHSSSSSVDSSSSCSFSQLDPDSNSICFFKPSPNRALLPMYALPKPANMNVDSFYACAPSSSSPRVFRKPLHRSLVSILSSSPKSFRKSFANNTNTTNSTSFRPRFGSDPNMRVQTPPAHSQPQTKALFLQPIPSRAQMDRQVSPKLGNISSGGFDFHEHDTGNNDTVPHPKISMDGSTRSMENGSKSIMISGGSSSNLEQLSISPKGPSSGDRMGTKLNLAATKSGIQLENQHDLLEYPFITLQKFPPSFINKIGGFVSCRSVKILDGVEDDGEIRENWWSEIRQEIRSHARCLGCNMVVGYSEDTVIWDDVVVLCASGTAASGNLHYMLDLDTNGSIFGPAFLNKNDVNLGKAQGSIGNGGEEALPSSASSVPIVSNGSGVWGGSCSYAHIPYLEYTLPFTSKCGKCQCCGKGRVPDVLFTTIEPPSHFDITGRGCLIQAKVLRLKKDLKGESNAKEISDALPFIEYEIHRQLINKLKVKGMNALFGLKLKVSMGDRTIIGTATATACYMTALSTPSKPKLICSSAFPNDPNYLQRCQKRLNLKIAENEKYYGLNPIKRIPSTQSNVSDPVEHDQEDGPESEFTSGNKDTCVLEIDDSEDADILDSLMDPYPPPYVQVFSTEELVGISKGLYVETCQTFSQASKREQQQQPFLTPPPKQSKPVKK
ncbi:hypothetical protein TCAL_02531 [Tigriopus californicus]|uniref:C2 domain-containing protein n=1 Tax=Tigriopus californicus TaxID=6832 RepID=A0A553P7R6_TIGCA|nr:hypothetical protein TCAL_02531 [Tigriopus californicus]